MTDATDQTDRYRASRQVTIIGAVINLVLSALKIVFGIIGQSQALVADGIHSFSDLLSDFLVLFAAKQGAKDADSAHPYGYARIETVATVAVGGLLIVVAIGIIVAAGDRIMNPGMLLHPGMLALVIAFVSVAAKEAIYHYTVRVANRLRSNLLRANAWHHRSDSVSTLVVIVGIVGTMAGLSYLDTIGAIIVAVMIGKMGWELGWQSIRELMDAGLDQDKVAQIRGTILAVEGVRELHLLRTRRTGANAFVDVHILVDPKVSISEGHQISETVSTRLTNSIEEVGDVTVHIDPEDDQQVRASLALPLRSEVLRRLRGQWQGIDEINAIKTVTLHYLGGRLHVEIVLPLSVAGTVERATTLTERLTTAANALPDVGSVKILYQ